MRVIVCAPLFPLIVGVTLLKILGLAVTLFITDRNMAVKLIKTAQCLLFKLLLMFGSGNIAKGNKNGITRVIMGLVERFKLFVTEVRNICWFTATVIVISTCGVEMLAHGLPQD